MLTQIFKLLFDASAVDRGLAHVDKAAKKVGGSLAKELTGRIAGAFAAGAVIDRLVNFTGAVIDNADALDEMSDLLNMSVEDIQRLQVAAHLAGVPFRKLKGILDGITASQAQAMSGDKRALGIFGILGIDPSKSNPMQIMVQAMEASQRGAKEQGAVADLFGKRINDIAATVRQLKGLGPIDIISTEQSKRIGKAKDDFDEMMRRMMVSATPVITTGLEAITPMVENFRRVPARILERITGLPAPLVDVFRNVMNRAKITGEEQPIPKPQPNPNPNPEAARAAIPLGVSGDSLARIGLFAGGRAGAGERLVSIAASQLAAQRTTNRLLAQLADNQ